MRGIQELADEFMSTKSERSFSNLVNRILPMLTSRASYMLKDDAAAEDVAMNVLEDFWCRPNMYDSSKAKFTTWIYAVLNNRAKRLIYSKNRKFAMKYVSIDAVDAGADTFCVDDGMSSMLYRNDNGDMVRMSAGEAKSGVVSAAKELMPYLPPVMSVMLKDRYIDEKDIHQMVKEYGKPESTIRYYLSEGRKMLEDMIANEVPECIEMARDDGVVHSVASRKAFVESRIGGIGDAG